MVTKELDSWIEWMWANDLLIKLWYLKQIMLSLHLYKEEWSLIPLHSLTFSHKHVNIYWVYSVCVCTGLCLFLCLPMYFSVCCSVSEKCNECHWSVCVLIARDRYHQSCYHWQINESAVFSSCPVCQSDLLSHSHSALETQKTYYFFCEF